MLRAGVNDKDNPLILMGLSDGNIDRLRNGFPIKAEIRSFGVDLPGSIAVIHGKTENEIAENLKKHGLVSAHSQGSVDPRLDQEEAARAAYTHLLICTVGLPRSGKTSWARRQAWPIVCPDSIRLALHGQRFVGRAEPHVWAIAKTMVSALFLAGHKHVILDATNTTKKRRDEWINSEWGTFFKTFTATIGDCISRAGDDAEIVPVIERMAKQMEPLTEDEKHW